MKTKLLKKWRKDWSLSFDPATLPDEKDKYIIRGWNKKTDGRIIMDGTLSECLNYEHKMLRRKIDEFERKIHDNICNRLT